MSEVTAHIEVFEGSHVGDIKFSMLAPSELTKLPGGDKWELLAGQPLDEGWALSGLLSEDVKLLLDHKLPDARGKFLRALNVVDTVGDNGDPQPGRFPGSYQADELKKHNHGLNLPRKRDGNADPHTGFQYDELRDNVTKATSVVGGAETRPKNIAVYVYVRVRR
ncbi:MAG: hypothetical protein HC897_00320 [Thermoanaerobaculia bacterium]|nr:hypothetical protein [Thermoanaerobaculia bacterium]